MSQPPDMPPVQNAISPGHLRPSRVMRRWWILALLCLLVIIGSAYMLTSWFGMRGPLYESRALIEINESPGVSMTSKAPGTVSSPSASHPNTFLNTQIEIARAEATLKRALKESDLINRLGGNQTAALERVQRSLQVKTLRGTDLIEISYRDEDPVIAKDAVTAVYQTYVARRTELEVQQNKEQLEALQQELEQSRKRLAEKRADLIQAAQKMGIIWQEENGAHTSKLADQAQSATLVEKQLYEARQEKEQLVFEIYKLLLLEDNETMLLLHYEESPNAAAKKHYERYMRAYMELQDLKNAGLGEGHPELRVKEKQLAELKATMKNRALSVKETLKIKLKLVEERMAGLEERVRLRQQQGSHITRSSEDFNQARKDYQAAKQSTEETEQQIQIEHLTANSASHPAIVHEQPSLASHPSTKGRAFYTTLFTAISIPLATIVALTLCYLAEFIFPKRVDV
ncbi:hypothetical protein JIN77_00085 [Verrucomicrobiaceae bacterium R5-34]|nr:hypothetical protein [Verrucomicrobiaceae bacterium R5-34]